MQHIPSRTQPSVPSLAWIVIAKSIDEFVPKWIEFSNQKRLTEGNPNIIHNQVSAVEVLDTQIRGFIYASCMLHQACV
jgi:hypothetical protein